MNTDTTSTRMILRLSTAEHAAAMEHGTGHDGTLSAFVRRAIRETMARDRVSRRAREVREALQNVRWWDEAGRERRG